MYISRIETQEGTNDTKGMAVSTAKTLRDNIASTY